MLSIEQLLPKPTFADTGSTMCACYLFIFFVIYAVVKQTSVLSSTPLKEPVWKLVLSIFLEKTTI